MRWLIPQRGGRRQRLLGAHSPPPTTSLVDRTTTRIEDTLTTHGYDVNSEIRYVTLANEIAKLRTLITTITLVGFLIVAISMAGLANTLTMSVLERTREIGILRLIGARARDIRRIFATETLTLALTGWLIAIPLGYLLDRFLVWLVKTVVNVNDPSHLPALVPRARPRRHDPAGTPHHPRADPARCPPPTRRRARYA